MRNTSLFLILFSVFTQVSAQESSQTITCTMKETSISNPNELLNYLFNKYGVEMSEQIVLEMKAYQNQNKVTVLSIQEYELHINNLDQQIQQATDLDVKLLLEKEKAKVVSIETIEKELTTVR
jgi:hypothetical protein